MSNESDIKIPVLAVQDLKWGSQAEVQESMFKLYQYAEQNASDSISWYGESKKGKAKASRILRVVAIGLTTLGGLAPILSAVNLPADSNGNTRYIIGQMGYLFLGLAAACIAFDRFFGFSSGWMRYISTKISLEKLLSEFRFDWAMRMANYGSQPASPEQIQQMIQQLKEFLVKINSEVERETTSWIEEFKTSLSEIEKNAKAQTEASKPGAIDVTVTNGMVADNGFSVKMNGMIVKSGVLGTRHQIGYVPPGTHQITVDAVIGGKPLSASELIIVSAGEIAKVTLALPIQDAQP